MRRSGDYEICMKAAPNCESHLMRFARAAVMETLSRDPRMALQGDSSVKEGKVRPYFLLPKYPFLRGSRKRLAFLASDAVL